MEKSIEAISLLFAIYQVKPSPYCILDEVDAPLDDVNIHKFTKVLKQFADETQFIIVTQQTHYGNSKPYVWCYPGKKRSIETSFC